MNAPSSEVIQLQNDINKEKMTGNAFVWIIGTWNVFGKDLLLWDFFNLELQQRTSNRFLELLQARKAGQWMSVNPMRSLRSPVPWMAPKSARETSRPRNR